MIDYSYREALSTAAATARSAFDSYTDSDTSMAAVQIVAEGAPDIGATRMFISDLEAEAQ